MNVQNYTRFRQEIYNFLMDELPKTMKDGDLSVLVELLAYVFGDLYDETTHLPWQIDIDYCETEHLKHLASLVHYPWNNALTDEQQRETIKYWMLIRRNRGTSFSYINLIRLFGKDSTTYYSNSDHSGVRVVEYDPNVHHEYDLFPGDIRIEVPELSTSDIRLMGTRVVFAFVLFLGAYNEQMQPSFWYKIKKWIETFDLHGWNPMIRDFGPQHEYTKVQVVYDWQLTHPSRSGQMFASVLISPKYKTPWVKGFIFNVAGLENYKGIFKAEGNTFNFNDVFYY